MSTREPLHMRRLALLVFALSVLSLAAFDTLRMGVVQLACRDCTKYRALERCVDTRLLRAWLLAYGAMVTLVFVWLTRLSGRVGPGLLGASVFCLHPASLFFASYPDSTFLSALLVTWFHFGLWLVSAPPLPERPRSVGAPVGSRSHRGGRGLPAANCLPLSPPVSDEPTGRRSTLPLGSRYTGRGRRDAPGE